MVYISFNGLSGLQHLSEDKLEDVWAHGFGDDLVDFVGPGLLDILLLSMTSTRHNHRLRDLVRSVEVSDLL